MRAYRLGVAPGTAEVIRKLHPDLKRSIRSALDALGDDPTLGDPLRGELEGLHRYRVRRFRIVYEVERRARLIRVLAVGPRRSIYEDVADTRSARRGERRSP